MLREFARPTPQDQDNTEYFGSFEWRAGARQLRRDGCPVLLGSRALELLAVLIEGRGSTLSKDRLLNLAWPGVVVAENNLSVQIAALRKLLGEDAIQTVSGRGYRWAWPLSAQAPADSSGQRRPSIAVLAFSNPSGDDTQDYLAEGLASDIEAALSRSPWLFVVCAAGSGHLQNLAAADAAHAMGVSYLVRGSVRRSDDGLRVSAELTHRGSLVWAERFDRPMTELFALQDQITAQIVGAVEPVFLKREEQVASRSPLRDLQRWDLVMRARWHYWRSTYKHIEESKRLLTEVLKRVPDDPLSLALQAFNLSTEVWSGWSADPRASAQEARRLAQRAVSLDDQDAFAHFALGVALLSFGQLDAAVHEQQRALLLYPHFAAASAELGRLLIFKRDIAAGEAYVGQALACSPTDPRRSLWVFSLGLAAFMEQRHADGIRHAQAGITLRPDWFFNHLLLGACLASTGRNEAARDALTEGMRLSPRLTEKALRVGHPFVHDDDFNRYVAALKSAGWSSL